MSLTLEEQTRLIDHYFDVLHPEIAKDDHNLNLISQFIRANTRGMDHLNLSALDWAVQQQAGRLHYYQHVDVSAQLAAGADAKRQLQAEQADKAAKTEVLRKQLERDARQDARRPGASSAFEGATDRTESERQARIEAQKARDAITLRARHQQFDQLIREARMEASAEVHSRKQGRWNALYANIKQKFPEPELTATF